MKKNIRFLNNLIKVYFVFLTAQSSMAQTILPYQNAALSFDVRVNDLISRMTLSEKISQLGNSAPAVSRLGISSYEYWSEALHGIARSGLATSFPQAIALSSTWDPELVYNVASAISDEARVKHNLNGKGLTYWSPTINMARDPRWGRAEENYGEDVYLATQIALSFVKGMQGNDKKYLKTVATVKHFACNNVEADRYYASSNADERSLREYYLPVFKSCVKEAKVFSVMSAYNAIDGVPCPANRTLLTNILRNEWAFVGYVVSDCGAINNISSAHHYVSNPSQATAISLKNGTDLNCGTTYSNYSESSITSGILNEEDIDTALKRIFKARFFLGEFDDQSTVPYSTIPSSRLDCSEFRDLSLKAANEAIVLLKNEQSILPLNIDSIQSVAVIGPNANTVQLGGYSGTPAVSVSPLQGIKSMMINKTVNYAYGCSISGAINQTELDLAVNYAKSSDIAIVVCGTDLNVADEGTDRASLDLPGSQEKLIRAVYKANPKTIVVLVTGFSLSINWVQDSVPGIISAWYNGQSQGTAIANVLFGNYNPAGRLSTTWYKSASELPPINDYDIKNNRTYMYFKGTPLYSFGYGLSYTTFEYGNLNLNSTSLNPYDSVTINLSVKNTGKLAGDEVIQLFVHVDSSAIIRPVKELKGFKRINLQSGETKTVSFKLKHSDLSYYDIKSKAYLVESGKIDLMIGSSSDDIRIDSQIYVAGAIIEETYRQNPFILTEAEHFENKSQPIELVSCSEGGQSIDSLANNSYIVFKNLNFSTKALQFNARLATSLNGSSIQIMLDSLNGALAGTLTISSTGDVNTYITESCQVNGITGVRDVYLIFKTGNSSACRLNWFYFQENISDLNKTAENYQYTLKLFPNPATSVINLNYELPVSSDVTIKVYNTLGEIIASFSSYQTAGFHKWEINTSDYSIKTGLYIVNFCADNFSQSELIEVL